jgi:t-SNARE complex subunit (syntaxin)
MDEWLNSIASEQGPVSDCTKHDSKFSGFVKTWKYFDKLRHYQILFYFIFVVVVVVIVVFCR